jgi:hypothetical protein
MPCRYFEPLQIVQIPFHPHARLPLVDEYDGLCHAGGEPVGVHTESRFSGCNHGNRDNLCGRLPVGSEHAVLRLTVAKQDGEALEVLAIEEANHTPLRWQTVRFLLRSEEIMPDLPAICQRAQLLAFCRSYLKRSATIEAGQK